MVVEGSVEVIVEGRWEDCAWLIFDSMERNDLCGCEGGCVSAHHTAKPEPLC